MEILCIRKALDYYYYYSPVAWVMKLVRSEDLVVYKTKRFLENREHLPDNYKLNIEELYEVALIILSYGNLGLVNALKKGFDRNLADDAFFDLLVLLDKHNWLSAGNFKYIFRADYFVNKFIYQLFLNFEKQNFHPSATTLYYLFSKVETFYRPSNSAFITAMNNAYLLDGYLIEFLSLENRIFELIVEKIAKLEKFGLLNELTIINALRSIPKIPSQSMLINISKQSRKKLLSPRSQLKIGDNIFFIEHCHAEKQDVGGEGKVKKLFADRDSNVPVFKLKRFIKSSIKAAKRENKYNTLFGRRSCYFSRNKKVYVASEWYRGRVLSSVEPTEWREVSFSRKLSLIISGVSELDVLHRHSRVHGDIKRQNFIVDFDSSSLKLIDLSSTRKVGSKTGDKFFAHTPKYLDSNRGRYNFCDDIYSMSFVIARFFPELYIVNYPGPVKLKLISNDNYTLEELAIIKLVNNMHQFSRTERCTCANALEYCKAVERHLSQLTKEKLMVIYQQTLEARATVDNILHGQVPRLV